MGKKKGPGRLPRPDEFFKRPCCGEPMPLNRLFRGERKVPHVLPCRGKRRPNITYAPVNNEGLTREAHA